MKQVLKTFSLMALFNDWISAFFLAMSLSWNKRPSDVTSSSLYSSSRSKAGLGLKLEALVKIRELLHPRKGLDNRRSKNGI